MLVEAGGSRYRAASLSPLRGARQRRIAQGGGLAFQPRYWRKNGGVIAQLGERFNGIEEVGGSIPPGSTKSLPNPSA